MPTKFKLRFRKKSPSPLALDPHELLMAITNNLSGAIIVLDDRQKVFHYNAATLDLLNTNIDLMGKNLSRLLSLKDQTDQPFDLAAHIAEARTPITYDDLRLSSDPDETLRLELVISPIRSNFAKGTSPISGYVLFLRDITEAKSLEEERNEFIGVVSHELRTPAAVVEGALSNLNLLLKDPAKFDKKAVSTSLAAARHQAKSLTALVGSPSSLSDSERRAKTSLRSVDIKTLLGRLAAEYTPLAAQKSLDFASDLNLADSVVPTHLPYLEEILRNFLSNAIKYTKSGRIAFRATDTKTAITISVQDTGAGISRTDQKHIFDKFYRSENYQTRKTDGIGLGLYIAFKLAKKLGCDLTLDSRLNSGSTFSLILPRALANKTN